MTDCQMLFRAAEDWADLEVRTEGDEGVIFGIAVPWDKPTRIDSRLTEEFAPGAFDGQMKRGGARSVFLARGHLPQGGSPIGRLTLMRNDAKGLYIEGKVSRTLVGEETLTLVRDGVLDRLSIGFVEGQNQLRQDRTTTITRRLTAMLREVGVVPNPAYMDVTAGARSAAGCTCGQHEADPAGDFTRSEQAAALLGALPVLPPMPRSA